MSADPNSAIQQTAARTNLATGLPDTATLGELLSVLSDSLYPSQREWAADRLSKHDWRFQPQIVEGLLVAAKDDPAPMVRAACIRSLVKMKAGTTYVVKTLMTIRTDDKDASVRTEAELALGQFAPGGARATDAAPSK